MFSFDVVPGKIVKDILDTSLATVIDLVQDTYLDHDAGRTVNPDSYFLRFPQQPDARIIALPASIESATSPVAGIKWISSFPANIVEGIPRASAVLIINDHATGYPIALLEAATISAVRTAALAAVAARAIGRHVPGNGHVAIIGAGVIARTILRYLAATGYPVSDLLVHDLEAESAASLTQFAARDLGIASRTATSVGEALTAQTVITATTASRPYIMQLLRPGQVVLNISLRDFHHAVILAADNYLDDVEHCMKADTSPHLAEQFSGGRNFVSGTLADILRGRARPDGKRAVVFSPFGLGVLDLAVGQFVLVTARKRGLTLEVPNFFGETRRW